MYKQKYLSTLFPYQKIFGYRLAKPETTYTDKKASISETSINLWWQSGSVYSEYINCNLQFIYSKCFVD